MNDYIASIRAKIGHDRLLLVGASVFIHKDGKLLLQRRIDDGTWCEHGGSMELGETVEETARRELFEETGLIAGKLELFGVYSGSEFYHTYPNGDKVYFVVHSYLCDDYSGTMLPESDETAELKWFGLDELPSDIMPLVRRPLADCVAILKKRNG